MDGELEQSGPISPKGRMCEHFLRIWANIDFQHNLGVLNPKKVCWPSDKLRLMGQNGQKQNGRQMVTKNYKIWHQSVINGIIWCYKHQPGLTYTTEIN